MSYHPHEDEDLLDISGTDRRIRSSLYCANCGYDLRTLPIRHACPECGQEYSAQPLDMQGIFRFDDMAIPVSDVLIVLFCVVAGAILLARGISPPVNDYLIFAGVLFVMAVFYGRVAVVKVRKFLRLRQVAARIARDAERD